MKPFYLFTTLLFLLIGCEKQTAIYPIDKTVPDQRTFYMGFSTFPYDITRQAQDSTYQYVVNNGDIVYFQLDNGIPWQEALSDGDFPQSLGTLVYDVLAVANKGKKIFLAISPTDNQRENLALYWNDAGIDQPLPYPWSSYSFDSPQVIEAYIKYCKRLIDTIYPDFFAYAIDINYSFKEESENFKAFMRFADTVYHRLKQDYPDLPIFITVRDQAMNKNKAELLAITKFLLNYSDWVAVVTYPFWQYDYSRGDANPQLFPNDWLEEMRNLYPSKPFAVASTAYCAQDLILPSYGVNIKGSEQWQADYVQKVLLEANKLKSKFVIWTIFRDYDNYYDNLSNPSEMFKLLKDTGLEDEVGYKRSSYYVWKQWFDLAIEQL